MANMRIAFAFILAAVAILFCCGISTARQLEQGKERQKNNFIAFEVMRLVHQIELNYRAGSGSHSFLDSEDLFKRSFIGASLASALGVPRLKSISGDECQGDNKPFHGYFFRLVTTIFKPGRIPGFTLVAFPAVATGDSKSGDYSFFIDDGDWIRVSSDPKVLANATSMAVGEPEAPSFSEITNNIKVTRGEGSIPGQLFSDGTVCIVDAKDPSQCKKILFKVPAKIMKKTRQENGASSFYGIFDLDGDRKLEVLLGYWLPDDPECSPRIEDQCAHVLVYKKVGKNYRLSLRLQASTEGYEPGAWFLNESPHKTIIMTRYQGSSGGGLFYLDLKKRSLELMSDDIGVVYVFPEDLDNDGVKEFFVLGRGPDYDRLGGGLIRWKRGAYRLRKLWWPDWEVPPRLMDAKLINVDDRTKGIIALLESSNDKGNAHSSRLELAVFKIMKGNFAIVDKVALPEVASASSIVAILQTSLGEEIYIGYIDTQGRAETLKCVYRNGKIICDGSHVSVGQPG